MKRLKHNLVGQGKKSRSADRLSLNKSKLGISDLMIGIVVDHSHNLTIQGTHCRITTSDARRSKENRNFTDKAVDAHTNIAYAETLGGSSADLLLWNLHDRHNRDIDHLITSVSQLGNFFGLLNIPVHKDLSLRHDKKIDGLVDEPRDRLHIQCEAQTGHDQIFLGDLIVFGAHRARNRSPCTTAESCR